MQKKILEYLSEHEASESELVKKLNMSESTVNYTIKLLMDAELIKIYGSKYSEKGKDMKFYTATDEPIVIVPKQSLLSQLGLILPAIVLCILMGGLLPLFGLTGIDSNTMVTQSDEPFAARSMQVAQQMESSPESADSVMMAMVTDDSNVSNTTENNELPPLMARNTTPVSSIPLLWFAIGAGAAIVFMILTLIVIHFYKR